MSRSCSAASITTPSTFTKKAFSYLCAQKYDVGLRVRAESTNYGVENGLHVTAAWRQYKLAVPKQERHKNITSKGWRDGKEWFVHCLISPGRIYVFEVFAKYVSNCLVYRPSVMDEGIVVADLWSNTDMEKTKYLDEILSPSATITATLQGWS